MQSCKDLFIWIELPIVWLIIRSDNILNMDVNGELAIHVIVHNSLLNAKSLSKFKDNSLFIPSPSKQCWGTIFATQLWEHCCMKSAPTISHRIVGLKIYFVHENLNVFMYSQHTSTTCINTAKLVMWSELHVTCVLFESITSQPSSDHSLKLN